MELQYVEKFEYINKRYSGFTMSKIIEELNKMGAEGWELISNVKDEIGRPLYIFKRRVLVKQFSQNS